jgi:hypothetical protein
MFKTIAILATAGLLVVGTAVAASAAEKNTVSGAQTQTSQIGTDESSNAGDGALETAGDGQLGVQELGQLGEGATDGADNATAASGENEARGDNGNGSHEDK